jgi:hypothetical protein
MVALQAARCYARRRHLAPMKSVAIMSVESSSRTDAGGAAWRRPTSLSGAVFAAKVLAFRTQRAALDAMSPPPRLSRRAAPGLNTILAESHTPLRSDPDPRERLRQLGKIQNLRLACRALDGVVIPAGSVFSFWRHIGPPVARRGYVPGRMLQEGCMVAAVGGGLCQLSNALYEAALQSGCRIIERHAHSRVVPGSTAAIGRDATVAWNYVDLRFAPACDMRISAKLDRAHLRICFLGAATSAMPGRLRSQATDTRPSRRMSALQPRNCATCNELDCPHVERFVTEKLVRTFLVDEAWTEFRAYVAATRQPQDRLARPFGRPAVPRYDWNLDGFDRISAAPLTTLRRSLAVRAAGSRGAAVRRAELVFAERMASALARCVDYDVETLTVAQSYLPFLWRDGLLGGRDVTVLMTSLPLLEIERRLDAAAVARPGCASLSDFRAPAWIVQAETEALAAASHVVGPHADIAALFGERAVKLAWAQPPVRPRASGERFGRIAFVGPTAARKGAYAVREAAIALDLEVAPLGSELEGDDFWRGVRLASAQDRMDVDAVVQPAVIEHQPRRLLSALAAGVPVIASAACGIEPRPGLTLVPPDDADALIAALRRVARPAA